MPASSRRKDTDDRAALALAALLAFVPSFAESEAAIIAELEAVYLAAYRAADSTATLPADVQARATAFASDRAATLVRDLAQTTQDDIAGLVDEAEAGDWSLAEIGDALSGHSTFGAARALLIAATETAIAWGTGQRGAADDRGDDEKRWLGGQCEDCQANAEDGWIGIDEAFSSGDDDVPSHPNCGCEVEYRSSTDKRAPVAIVKEAACVTCGRWVGANMNANATAYCPKCKATRVRAKVEA